LLSNFIGKHLDANHFGVIGVLVILMVERMQSSVIVWLLLLAAMCCGVFGLFRHWRVSYWL
jgi:hypothetical protein